MLPARKPPERRGQDRSDVRLLMLDPSSEKISVEPFEALLDALEPGDLVVVNDAATLPASIQGHDAQGRPIEVRLCGRLDAGPEATRWCAVLFGAGDWRAPTEHRPAPPVLRVQDRFLAGPLSARIEQVHTRRLVNLRFDQSGARFWSALYRVGRPIQYSHLGHAMPLASMQTAFSGAPTAVEMPSAGRPLSWRLLLGLKARGVQLAALTHAAGISSTGDDALDALLPFPERYHLPRTTAERVRSTRANGGRVLAVGTTVVRALEGSDLQPGHRTTDLVIGPGYQPRYVDGILSGIHSPQESHFSLLGAFCRPALLQRSHARARRAGLLQHEFGDSTLIWPARARARILRAS